MQMEITRNIKNGESGALFVLSPFDVSGYAASALRDIADYLDLLEAEKTGKDEA